MQTFYSSNVVKSGKMVDETTITKELIITQVSGSDERIAFLPNANEVLVCKVLGECARRKKD